MTIDLNVDYAAAYNSRSLAYEMMGEINHAVHDLEMYSTMIGEPMASMVKSRLIRLKAMLSIERSY